MHHLSPRLLMVALVLLVLAVGCDRTGEGGDDDDGGETIECSGSVCFDPNTGLHWQDPPAVVDPDGTGSYWHGAIAYCEDLELGGYSDWRLPDIEELRTLIRGCPGTETGGECAVEDGSVDGDWSEPCAGCTTGGPGDDSCFLESSLTDCLYQIAEDCNDSGAILSSSSFTMDEDDTVFWVVEFASASVVSYFLGIPARARCVREE